MRETWKKQQVSEGKLEDTTQRLDKESRTKEALKKELRALEETLFQVFVHFFFKNGRKKQRKKSLRALE